MQQLTPQERMMLAWLVAGVILGWIVCRLGFG
jgi:DNA-binding CsgD family transcriptional regulator